ncbi:MAG: hypothetical protein AUH85_11065 [Chloroflexi bacterium 13_1_40CM_4_68_4]|nr:MAG: hypothetical protein AUH85_11065 [Chloroflexi bacterium 13_1_40CM_4_68_4]
MGRLLVPGDRSRRMRAAQAANIAFLPLYPLLMRVLGAPFGGTDDGYLAAGILISNGVHPTALLGRTRSFSLSRCPGTQRTSGARGLRRVTVPRDRGDA